MPEINDFGVVKIQTFLEKQVYILKKSAFGVHCQKLVLVVQFFSRRRLMLTRMKISSPSLFRF